MNLNPLSVKNVMNRIKELQKDTDYQLKIMDDINNSGFFKFIWYAIITNKYKIAQLQAKSNIDNVQILLDFLHDIA